MATIAVQCPDCGSDQIAKYGTTSDGKQRYHCENEDCSRSTFILNYQQKARVPGVKDLIIDMTLNGSSIRDIARVLKISTTTVINEIKKSFPIATNQFNYAKRTAMQKNRGAFKLHKNR